MVIWPYLVAWSFLAASLSCHSVTESSESEETLNTTTLYPVTEPNRNSSEERVEKHNNSQAQDATSWKIEAAFAESKIPEQFKDNQTESKESKEEKSVNCSKEFRPSPPLGIIEDSGESHHVRGTPGNFVPMKKPSSGFHSAQHVSLTPGLYIPPKDLFRQNDFPYKIESSIFPRAKGGWSTQDSKPTVQAPVRVPAGGLYNSPDAFKDKPGVDGQDDNFGLEFNRDVKDGTTDVKKRINPWMNLMRLVTAFIPVGILISALTPSVITIENTDMNSNHGQASRRRGKLCYKLPCEDPEALSRTLQWLLSYHQSDSRARFYT